MRLLNRLAALLQATMRRRELMRPVPPCLRRDLGLAPPPDIRRTPAALRW